MNSLFIFLFLLIAACLLAGYGEPDEDEEFWKSFADSDGRGNGVSSGLD